jgi:hypothetical protein
MSLVLRGVRAIERHVRIVRVDAGAPSDAAVLSASKHVKNCDCKARSGRALRGVAADRHRDFCDAVGPQHHQAARRQALGGPLHR